MESDAKGRAALLAAVSALSLSLGVTVATSAAADESPKENRYAKPQKPQSQQLKLDSHQVKGESQQIKFHSAQVKGESQQIKFHSAQVKGESQQLKLDSAHVKGESQQIKGESPQQRPQ